MCTINFKVYLSFIISRKKNKIKNKIKIIILKVLFICLFIFIDNKNEIL